MSTIYGNPVHQEGGFVFSSFEEFQDAVSKVEITIDLYLNDASCEDETLFKICDIGVKDLPMWFDEIQSLDTSEKAAMFHLIDDCHHPAKTALDKLPDVDIFCGSLVEAATELFNDIYLPEIPEQIRAYVDYVQFANDMRMSGDFYEFIFAGQTYTCTNAHNH